MNQLIKELITQSGGHWNYGDFNMPSSVEFQEQDIEKFAELIVRECALIAFHNVVNLSSIADAEDVEANLREHFGVE